VPPRERRGLVLVDPPFEQPDEFDRLAAHTIAAVRKWPTGIYLLWYPINDRTGPQRLARALARSGLPRIVQGEMLLEADADAEGLRGSGLIVINPPWRLPEQMAALGSALAARLRRLGKGESRLDWLAREK
jgi:23S rRNA (adenine2030-N6)-methyltransferase